MGYTNAGFLLAGECIRKISGESWEWNLKNRIFDPLQMTRSIALAADVPKQSNIAYPHTLVLDTLKLLSFPLMDNLAPAASIGSSVKDMSNWLLCQLDSGKFNGQNIIPFKVIKDTRTPRSIIGNARNLFNRSHYELYGLGWDLTDYEGREIVSHTGGVNGFLHQLLFYPKKNWE
ncbi:MAG: beta-lactamase family protein [Bacteroidales bacterium]|nr:beta-lactamase family protein [Bacteroidales bacterium]